MKKIILFLSVTLVFFSGCDSSVDPPPVDEPDLPIEREGRLDSGALWMTYIPANWNRDLIVVAPGYAPVYTDVRLREMDEIADILDVLGYGWATTSYHKNGLVLPQAVEDIDQIVDIIRSLTDDRVNNVYMVGFSLGGLVTAHVVEKLPHQFDGGIAACGPCGAFQEQLDYLADFRVVFDYFFADKIEGWPVWQEPGMIEIDLISRWNSLVPLISAAVTGHPAETEQLIAVTGAPVDAGDPGTYIETVIDVLWYQVFATNDAVIVAGGFMYDNNETVYAGSDDDAALNAGVERFTGETQAFQFVQTHYETSGELQIPLVVLHTSLDAIIPAWHMNLYEAKASPARLQRSRLVERYGHCNFTGEEIIAAFSELLMMTGKPAIAEK